MKKTYYVELTKITAGIKRDRTKKRVLNFKTEIQKSSPI